eukprot:m.116636 g.116636  ORF g.116636 m.116636 type:complete len:2018 (+) comp13151_c1_seq2:283-6336(+)
MAATRMFVALGMLAAARQCSAQSITGRHTGTDAQARGKKGSSGGGSFSGTQSCNACTDSGGGKSKLSSLTLRYVGSNVGGNNNAQGTMGDKWGFSGSNLPASATWAVTDKNSRSLGSYQVGLNGEFTISPSKFESMTYFSIAGTSTRVFIHTSCSVPLRVNDQFGSLVVVDFRNEDSKTGASCQPCTTGPTTQRRKRQVWTYPPAWGYTNPTAPTWPSWPSYPPPHQMPPTYAPPSNAPPTNTPPTNAPPTDAPPPPPPTNPPPPPFGCDCDDFGSRPFTVQFRVGTGVPTGSGSLQDGKGGAVGTAIPAGCNAVSINCDSDGNSFNGVVPIDAVINVFTNQATETTCIVNGCGAFQTIEIHTSCSRRLATGDVFGALQVFDFPGMCPGPPPPTAPTVPPPPTVLPPGPPPGSCDCDNFDSRPDQVEFLVTSGPAFLPGLGSLQEGKGGATGTPIPANCAAVQVNCFDAKSSNSNFFSGIVAVGGRFVAQTNQATETECRLVGCGATQTIEIHTSCSKRLANGDQFGALTVFDFPGRCGTVSGPDCPPPCYDDLNDCPQCQICPGFDKDFKPSVLSVNFLPGSTVVTNRQEGKAVVSGIVSASTATVSCSKIGFFQQVGAGQPFQITNVAGGGADLDCTVSSNGQTQSITLHVSCSKELSVGDIFGSFEVTGFVLVNKKSGFSISSADPGVCPGCELCCLEGDMTVPDNVEIPSTTPAGNNDALQAWANSAVCIEQTTGNHLPIEFTQALLNGADTCTVTSTVTWTCKDDCGNILQQTRTFTVVDKTPPIIVDPPVDLTVECSGHNGQIPSEIVGNWLTQTWKALDKAQNALPCNTGGGNIYVSGSPPTGGAPTQPPSYGTWSSSQFGTYGTGSQSTGSSYGSYSQTGYGSGNAYYRQAEASDDEGSGRYTTNSVNCSYCQFATYSPVCAYGVQYDNVCQARCHGHGIVEPGPCNNGITSTYTGAGQTGGVYSPGGNYNGNQGVNCHCSSNVYSPVCSRTGTQYDSMCHAHCAGEFNYYHGACSTVTHVNQVTQVYDPCGHCGNARATCCGSNGVQYQSPCHAKCHGITDFHYGSCTIYAPSTNCGHGITYTHSDVTYGLCSQNTAYQSAYAHNGHVNTDLRCGTATFTATDKCGNSVSTTANIFVLDTAAPVISGGSDLEWTCDADCFAYSIWESDAAAILQRWISGQGCLSATDCSTVSWSVRDVPATGDLCGKSGQVTFVATDAYGNVATKKLSYNFPRKAAYQTEPCYVCGQTQFGQKVKASLLELEVRYNGPSSATLLANVEPSVFGNVQDGQILRFYAGGSARLEEVQSRSARSSRRRSGGSTNSFPTNTVFTIGGGLSTTLHTSCSQPIALGDVLTFSNGASLTIVGFKTDRGSSDTCERQGCVPWSGNGPYTGPGVACPTCSYPNVCGYAGPAYPAAPPTPQYVPPTVPPCHSTPTNVCDGLYGNKPVEIRLQIVGGAPTLTHNQNGHADWILHPSSGHICPDTTHFTVQCTGGTTQTVATGGQYIWSGLNAYAAGDSRFASNSVCQIHGGGFFQRVQIHMSCGQRLYTGDQFGNFVIVGYTLPDGTTVDQMQCPQVPYVPPYVPPPTAPYSYSGYGGAPTTPYVPPPPSHPPSSHPTNGPPPPPTSVHYATCYQYMATVADYSSFYVALQNTHVNVALQQPGPFTVFAPINSAFNSYTNNLAGLFSDIGLLSSVVLLHVVHGEYRPEQLVHGMTLVTFNGPVTVQRYGNYISLVSADGSVKCNVVGSGYANQNGYVYGVDTILHNNGGYLPNPNPPTHPTAPPSAPVYVSPPTSYQPPLGNNPTCHNSHDACSTNGRLKSLTFRYVNYNAVNHQQDAAFPAGFVQEVAYQAGTYQLPSSVLIKVSGRNEAVTVNGWKFSLAMGEEFTVLGTAYGGYLQSVMSINVNGRKVKFKTNCAAPIGVGDQFGALVVVGFENSDGSVCRATASQASADSSSSTNTATSDSTGPNFSGTEIAAIIVGCVAAVGLIAGTVYIKYNSPKGRMSSTHD